MGCANALARGGCDGTARATGRLLGGGVAHHGGEQGCGGENGGKDGFQHGGVPNSLYLYDAMGAIAVPGAYACLGIVWLWGFWAGGVAMETNQNKILTSGGGRG